jgi:hypothetical protein
MKGDYQRHPYPKIPPVHTSATVHMISARHEQSMAGAHASEVAVVAHASSSCTHGCRTMSPMDTRCAGTGCRAMTTKYSSGHGMSSGAAWSLVNKSCRRQDRWCSLVGSGVVAAEPWTEGNDGSTTASAGLPQHDRSTHGVQPDDAAPMRLALLQEVSSSVDCRRT